MLPGNAKITPKELHHASEINWDKNWGSQTSFNSRFAWKPGTKWVILIHDVCSCNGLSRVNITAMNLVAHYYHWVLALSRGIHLPYPPESEATAELIRRFRTILILLSFHCIVILGHILMHEIRTREGIIQERLHTLTKSQYIHIPTKCRCTYEYL